MGETKRRKSGQFAKGHKGGPGRPPKKDLKPEDITSGSIRERFFKTFMKAFTEREMIDFCKKSQLNKRLFLQEIRKLLPVTIEQDSKVEFKPLQITIGASEPKGLESMKIKRLEARLIEQDKHLEAYQRALKHAGIVLDLPHSPERPAQLAAHEDGVFKSDADRHLNPREEDEDDNERIN